jgi:hypothetical protein
MASTPNQSHSFLIQKNQNSYKYQLKPGGNKMNQIRMHQLILSITLVIGMILTSSAFSQEVRRLC